MLEFEKHLIHKIEKWICLSDQCTDGDPLKQSNRRAKNKERAEADDIPFEYAVADLQLAFDNDKMMVLLEKRANFLMAGKFDDANKVEEEMTKLKDEKFDELTAPKAFFCTFH